MSYWTECNWRGKHLHATDMAVLTVTVKRHRRGELASRWAEETRPTLHFCVGESLDLDRLGLETSGLDADSPDSCYERAMAAINGIGTADPAAGLEWRLVEVGADRKPARNSTATQASEGEKGSWRVMPDLERRRAPRSRL